PVDDVVPVTDVDERVRRARALDTARAQLLVAIFVRPEVARRWVLGRRCLLRERRWRQKPVGPNWLVGRATAGLHPRSANRNRDETEDEDTRALFHGSPSGICAPTGGANANVILYFSWRAFHETETGARRDRRGRRPVDGYLGISGTAGRRTPG